MVAELSKVREERDTRKLARAYVVLALARDVAARYINERPANAGLHPLLTMLDMSNDLLEEVLEHSMPPDVATTSEENEICTELLM